MKEIAPKYKDELHAKRKNLFNIYLKLKKADNLVERTKLYYHYRDNLISEKTYLFLLDYKFNNQEIEKSSKQRLNLISNFSNLIDSVTEGIFVSERQKGTLLLYIDKPSFASNKSGHFALVPKEVNGAIQYKIYWFNKNIGAYESLGIFPVSELQFKAKLQENDLMDVYFDFPKGFAKEGQPYFDIIIPNDFLAESAESQVEFSTDSLQDSSSFNGSSQSDNSASASNSDEDAGFDSDNDQDEAQVPSFENIRERFETVIRDYREIAQGTKQLDNTINNTLSSVRKDREELQEINQKLRMFNKSNPFYKQDANSEDNSKPFSITNK